MKMGTRVVNKRFAKGKGEYENVINQIEIEDKCPFCPSNFKYHKSPILKRSGDWFITENSWPYKNAKHHFLIINRKHKETFSELDKKDWETIRGLTNWAIKNYKLPGGALALRFGDTDHTGATVCHIHAHIICPKLDKKNKSKTVCFPVG